MVGATLGVALAVLPFRFPSITKCPFSVYTFIQTLSVHSAFAEVIDVNKKVIEAVIKMILRMALN